MGLTFVNGREVDYRPPATLKTQIYDIDWACDKCGRTTTTTANIHLDGTYEAAEQPPPGWCSLSGWNRYERWEHDQQYFCSFACEIAWLEQGDWRPLVRAHIQYLRMRAGTPDGPDPEHLGDALTVALL